MEYLLRSLKKELAFVIRPVDTYSGKAVAKGIRARVCGPYPPPVVKEDGYLAFYGYPHGEYLVNISSDKYFTEEIYIQAGADIRTVPLIPDRRYNLAKGSTWIEAKTSPHSLIYSAPLSSDTKLISCHKDIIQIATKRHWDFSNRYITIGSNPEICFVRERIEKFSYKLLQPFEGPWVKNDLVAPVSLGRAAEDGYLFCPIGCFLPEHKEIIIWNEQIKTKAFGLIYGTGNNLGQLQQ